MINASTPLGAIVDSSGFVTENTPAESFRISTVGEPDISRSISPSL